MNGYLIDTNICVFYLRNRGGVLAAIQRVGFANLYISEITVLELLFGAENSANPQKNRAAVADFMNLVQVVPIAVAANIYAIEKVRLNRAGTPVDNFDLLIGVTAVCQNMTMVTNNTKHFRNIEGIVLVDWVVR
jgi:tRNA(fMet)-specific endonuclease VapC